MDKLLLQLRQKAARLKTRIIFPECADLRTLKALETIIREKLCQPVLIGSRTRIIQKSLQNNLKTDFSACQFIEADDPVLLKKFTSQLFKLRQNKSGAKKLTIKQAEALLKDPNYFSVMCLKNNLGDALVSGATSSTASTLKPAFQIIGTQKKGQRASGSFLMILPNRTFLFADCAVNPEPDAKLLAEITLETAQTAQLLGFKPQVALLSFSSDTSASHPLVEKVQEATRIVRRKNPQLHCDGEMQADVALVPAIAKYKFPRSSIQGNANVLIFPSLEAGNIAYKLVERLAGAQAVGTIIQGLKKPVNDLSRGCSSEDIVNLTAITAIQAHQK
jgi:phosphate acetyltransferase